MCVHVRSYIHTSIHITPGCPNASPGLFQSPEDQPQRHGRPRNRPTSGSHFRPLLTILREPHHDLRRSVGSVSRQDFVRWCRNFHGFPKFVRDARVRMAYKIPGNPQGSREEIPLAQVCSHSADRSGEHHHHCPGAQITDHHGYMFSAPSGKEGGPQVRTRRRRESDLSQ